MERFVVSARKYRPESFESLVGQKNIATTLKNSVTKGQLAHAYLFCGPRGVGKTSAARIFAKTINCLNPGSNMEPCGKCESCISFAEGRSYSIHELDAASNNSVEDIRQLNELVRIPPQIGKYSVYIIDEVHMLSQSAFNAFLKTLEEPPAHAIFILATTEKHKILPTILSRCQTYDFNRISTEDIVSNLSSIATKEEITCEQEALHVIAQKADGAMRDALTIFDQAVAFCGKEITYQKVISNLNVLDYQYYINLTDKILEGDHSAALLIFDEILSSGFNALHFVAGLSGHFRDLLVSKDKSTNYLAELAPSAAEKYSKQSAACTTDFLYEALSVTSACESGYKNSIHPRLHIELALLRLCRISNNTRWNKETPVNQEHAKKKVSSEKQESPEKQPASNTKEAPSSISIKSLLKKAEEINSSKGTNKSPTIGNDSISEENLNSVWSRMAEKEKSLPRLSTAISQTKPILKENTLIIFPVKNELQKKWMEQHCKARLVEFLRVNLNNKDLQLDIEVTPDDDPSDNKMYMPQEKDKFISEKYPEVKEMQKDLKLELK
jgi:DNA polymerase-3 subunit gamma/tau